MVQSCLNCYYVTGIKVDECQDCLQSYMVQDPDQNLTQNIQIKKKKKKHYLTPEERQQLQQRTEKNKLEAIERRLNKIKEVKAKKLKKLQQENKKNFYECKELCIQSSIFEKLDENSKLQYKIIQNLLNNCSKYKLISHFRKYQKQQISNRGSHAAVSQGLSTYTKPIGYIGIPVKVKEGNWLQKNGNNGEWIVAYHGTSLFATQKILSQGFKPGGGQSYINYKNTNKLSGLNQVVGNGIYCSPIMSTAEAYNKSARYSCILQCRVNPNKVKIGGVGIWVLNNSSDIIPYRVLLKKRY